MQPLAVKYRPATFDDVIAQGATITILQQQVLTSTFKHAYLFTGPAGCGKTTAARIFADMLNNHQGAPFEVDAASNNGVDNIRDIIDTARRKSLDSKYKVYIIDECHMLSIGAWNAMLKLLEEAPSGTIFIMCTTDPQKVPATILSRSQRYDFTKIPTALIKEQLEHIIKLENDEVIQVNGGSQDAVADIEWAIKEGIPVIEYTDEAITYIAKLADGGMRDAITMLDQCISYSLNIDISCVHDVLGSVDYGTMFDLLDALTYYNVKGGVELINTVYDAGKDISQFMKQFQYFVIDVCKFKMFGTLECTHIPQVDEYVSRATDANFETAVSILNWVRSLLVSIKWDTNPKAIIESSIILACINQTL